MSWDWKCKWRPYRIYSPKHDFADVSDKLFSRELVVGEKMWEEALYFLSFLYLVTDLLDFLLDQTGT